MILVITLSITYFIFCIWLINGLSSLNLEVPKNIKNDFISVIIAVKNEENNIKKLLDSLYKQSFATKKYEIIIINDNSSDKTENIILGYKIKIPNLRIISIDSTPDNWASKKWALNIAIEESRGNIILQTDGDCIPQKEWIEKMSAPFSKVDIGFVVGHTPLIKNEKKFLNRLMVFENLAQEAFNASCVGNNLTVSCVGRSIGFRKEFFKNANGYKNIQSIISGDDDLLMHKIVNKTNCKINYVITENSYVYSETPSSLNKFIQQRMRFASKGILYYKLPFISNELKLILPFLYILNFSTLIMILFFMSDYSLLFLIPYFIKTFSDFLLLFTFCTLSKIKWDNLSFITLSILHPLYIIVFSTMAPFKKVQWK